MSNSSDVAHNFIFKRKKENFAPDLLKITEVRPELAGGKLNAKALNMLRIKQMEHSVEVKLKQTKRTFDSFFEDDKLFNPSEPTSIEFTRDNKLSIAQTS